MHQSQNVYLSPILDADAETLFGWINDRETVIFNAPYCPVHHANHAEWFDVVRRRTDVSIFGIRTRADHRLIGSCQLHSIHPVHRAAELQIRIGDSGDRRKGYGREALHLLLGHGFLDLNLNRIYLQVFEDNAAAMRLYTTAGFRQEGRLREAAFIDGAFRSVLVMGLLQREFS